jgi:hypothetical protein
MTSREFNHDTAGAKRAAAEGPVVVTDRGHPSHVLLTYVDYVELTGGRLDLTDLLGRPDGVEHVRFEAPVNREVAVPADFA